MQNGAVATASTEQCGTGRRYRALMTGHGAAWDEIRDAKPEDWYVGPPTYVEHAGRGSSAPSTHGSGPKLGAARGSGRRWRTLSSSRAGNGAMPPGDPRGVRAGVGQRRGFVSPLG